MSMIDDVDQYQAENEQFFAEQDAKSFRNNRIDAKKLLINFS